MKKILNLSLLAITTVSLALTGFTKGNGDGIITKENILPKKVVKIVKTHNNYRSTYLFDTDGKLTSCTQIHYDYSLDVEDTVKAHFVYSDKSITVTWNDTSVMVFNLTDGKITSTTFTDESRQYTYSSKGFLASSTSEQTFESSYNPHTTEVIDETKFYVTKGNVNAFERIITDTEIYKEDGETQYLDENENIITVYHRGGEKNTIERNGKGSVTYGKELNNLNVDISLITTDFIESLPFWFSGYYGNRYKNLPASISYVQTVTYGKEKHNDWESTTEFTYTYEGEYLTEIKAVKTMKTIGNTEHLNETYYKIYYED